MNVQHKDLAQGRWVKMSLAEQMANIGSEISRAFNWKNKGNPDLSQKAFFRALELIDLTVSSIRKYSKLKEILRAREALVDFFCGENNLLSSEAVWKKHFDQFVCLARKNRL